MRILILYTKEGSGHHIAALALEAAIQEQHPEVMAEARNFMDFSPRRLVRFGERVYLSVVRRAPVIWERLYDNRELRDRTQGWKERLVHRHRHRIVAALTAAAPDVIVCTQAVPCETLALLKAAGLIHQPLVAVPTDFHVHCYWVSPQVDCFCVASPEAATDLQAEGVAPERIAVTGIPLRAGFDPDRPREDVRAVLGVRPEERLILLLGGGRGLVPYRRIVKTLQHIPGPLRVVSVLGTNRRKQRRLSRMESITRNGVILLPYVEDLDELMAASDVIVGKPGGLTAAEVIALRRPFVITHPLPGQEARNRDYLLRAGAALSAETMFDLRSVVSQLLREPAIAAQLQENCAAIARPHAATAIAELVVSRYRPGGRR